MMCGRGGGAEGRIGVGGEVFCPIQVLVKINHGGHHSPRAVMMPYSRRKSIQLSANMLGNR